MIARPSHRVAERSPSDQLGVEGLGEHPAAASSIGHAAATRARTPIAMNSRARPAASRFMPGAPEAAAVEEHDVGHEAQLAHGVGRSAGSPTTGSRRCRPADPRCRRRGWRCAAPGDRRTARSAGRRDRSHGDDRRAASTCRAARCPAAATTTSASSSTLGSSFSPGTLAAAITSALPNEARFGIEPAALATR